MTPTEEFQKKHGARWAAIAHGPELTEALLAVNAPILDEIIRLTPETIASPSGNVILAKLQGMLVHERALIELSVIHPEVSADLPPPDYPDPLEELREQQADEQDSTTSAGAGPWAEWMGEHKEEVTTAPTPEVPSPKPKRKRRGSK